MPDAKKLKEKQVNIRLNTAQFNQLTELSRKRGGVPKSQLIREAIHLFLEGKCKVK